LGLYENHLFPDDGGGIEAGTYTNYCVAICQVPL